MACVSRVVVRCRWSGVARIWVDANYGSLEYTMRLCGCDPKLGSKHVVSVFGTDQSALCLGLCGVPL